MEDQIEVPEELEFGKVVKTTQIPIHPEESNAEVAEVRGSALFEEFTNVALTSTTNVSLIPESPLISEPPSTTNSTGFGSLLTGTLSTPLLPLIPAPSSPSNEPIAIFIDIETIGLHPVKDIQPVQLAARAVEGTLVRTFDKYMIPSAHIEADTSRVHKLFVQEGQLVRLVNGVKEEMEGWCQLPLAWSCSGPGWRR